MTLTVEKVEWNILFSKCRPSDKEVSYPVKKDTNMTFLAESEDVLLFMSRISNITS